MDYEMCETCKWWKQYEGSKSAVTGEYHGRCTSQQASLYGGVEDTAGRFGCIEHRTRAE